MIDWLEQSDALHRRVQAVILGKAAPNDSFETLALEIARYQAATNPSYQRLLSAHGSTLDNVEGLVPVPVDAFRLTRVASHPPELDEARFLTSGTTCGARGEHCMRRTDTYRVAAIEWGRRALLPSGTDRSTVICLAPEPEVPSTSSLGFMMQAFLEDFDPVIPAARSSRWLLTESGIDVSGLERSLVQALRADRPALVLATSFALVHLLDQLGSRCLPSNGSTVVMQTGGFKGKTREVAPEEMRQRVADAFGIDESRIVGEYGMTELSSQLYEGTLEGAGLSGEPGWYIAPPWLRVRVLDPVTQSEQAEGEPGLACFVDLANVDSAVCLVTQDRVVRYGDRVRLLGRASAAPARGCSLGDEERLTRDER